MQNPSYSYSPVSGAQQQIIKPSHIQTDIVGSGSGVYQPINSQPLLQSQPIYQSQGPIVQGQILQSPGPYIQSSGTYIQSPPRMVQSSGPVYIQNVAPGISSSGMAFDPQANTGSGLKEAGVDTVLPGVGILGEGVRTGVGSVTGGLMTGVNSIKNGVLGGAETIANGAGVSTGRVKGHQQFFRPEHSHRSHGVGTGVAEIGSGILSLPVGLVGTSLNAVAKLGGAAIGTGLSLGGTAIGVGVDIVGNTAGVLTNTVRQIGHGLADLTHIHKKH